MTVGIWRETHNRTAGCRLNIRSPLDNGFSAFRSPLVLKYSWSLYSRILTVVCSEDVKPIGCHRLVRGQHKVCSFTWETQQQEGKMELKRWFQSSSANTTSLFLPSADNSLYPTSIYEYLSNSNSECLVTSTKEYIFTNLRYNVGNVPHSLSNISHAFEFLQENQCSMCSTKSWSSS